MKFNMLTVVEEDGINWTCMCECGNTTVTSKYRVRAGHTKSCGCLQRKTLIERNKKTRGILNTKYGCMFGAIRKTYRNKGLTYSLSDDQLFELLKDDCHYCGKEPSNIKRDSIKKHIDEFVYSGVDRVDNNRGYEVENVVSCCKQCNVAKNNMTHSEFITMCKTIADLHGS